MITKMLKQFKTSIDKYGLAVQMVDCGDDVSFAYSIGMAKHGLPDVIISSRDLKMVHRTINLMLVHWLKQGFKQGVDKNIISGKDGAEMPMSIIPLEQSDELLGNYVTQAVNFYVKYPEYLVGLPSFVQVLWPDDKGLLPNQSDYNADRFPQELLPAQKVH